ncbi:MAG: DUF6504 family protein [Lapillicoccus sp.]
MRRYGDPIEVRSAQVTSLSEAISDGSAVLTTRSAKDDRESEQARDHEGEHVGQPVPGTPSASPEAPLTTPQAFIWQGRLYVVRRILAHWRERRAWWREALDPVPGQATGIDVASREHQVWRVEASAGRTLGAGVFDLVHDDVPHPGETNWRLVRVAD